MFLEQLVVYNNVGPFNINDTGNRTPGGISFDLKHFLSFLFFLLLVGGNCWLTMNRKNGLCSALVKTGATREECCNSNESYANSVSVSWSEGGDLSPSLVFYMHLQGGVKCERCRGKFFSYTSSFSY